MSVIQSIRDKATWIISVVIGLALIAFIMQDASFSRGNVFAGGTTIGKINGEKIEKTDFDAKLTMIEQMNGGQGQREQMIGSVWNMMVQQTILEQAYKKLGFEIGGKELGDILFGDNPPQWLQQAFTDPATGIFDKEKARQQFAQLKKNTGEQAKQIEEAYLQPTIQQALAQKYQSLITQAIYVPKWMAEKINADNNTISNISYAYVPYNTIVDSTIKVTDEDVVAYVKKHASEFEKEEESRTISYVSFDAVPSSADSQAVYATVAGLKAEFETTTDAKAFVVAKASDIPYLDAFTTSSNIKVPNADVIKALPVGTVYGPYLDGKNFTLAKMIAKRSLPDSVKVRHILINTAQGATPTLPDSIAKKRIDSIQQAIAGGADFNSMVVKYSDDPGSKQKGGEYDFTSTQFATLSKEFAEVAFYGNTGDKKVVKVENSQYSGYHYIEVVSQKKIEEAYKVAYVSKAINASSETTNGAVNAASQFAAAAKDKKAFDEQATKLGKSPLPTGDILKNDFQVNGLGSNRAFVRWVFDHKVGTVSEPTEFGERYIVAIITNVNEAGLMNATAARPTVESFIRGEKKAQKILETFKGNSVEAYAAAGKTTVMRADSISFQSGFIPGVGTEPKVLGAAFNKAFTGKVSEPISGATGVFAIRVENISAKPNLGGSIDDQRKAMENNTRQQVGYRSLDALRKAAKVVDNRYNFY